VHFPILHPAPQNATLRGCRTFQSSGFDPEERQKIAKVYMLSNTTSIAKPL